MEISKVSVQVGMLYNHECVDKAFQRSSLCWSSVTFRIYLCAVISGYVSFLWLFTLIASKKTHLTPCHACAALNYLSVLPLGGKTASQHCPRSHGKDIHQHRPAFPLRCRSILVTLIKPHRFLFIKIMPRKPWIFSVRCTFSRMPGKGSDMWREGSKRTCKLVKLFFFKRVPNERHWGIGV